MVILPSIHKNNNGVNMRVQVISVKSKDITTKTGQQMTLRLIQGSTAEGDVFKGVLHREHPDIRPGLYQVEAGWYVNYDAELASRINFVALPSAPDTRKP